MLKIRLTRIGRKKRPHYRLVVAEHTAPVQGKYLVALGNYDPITKQMTLKKDSIIDWLNKGAQPSNTVSKLLLSQKIKHKLINYQQKPKRKPKALLKKEEEEGGKGGKQEKPKTGDSAPARKVEKDVEPENDKSLSDKMTLQKAKTASQEKAKKSK